PTALPGARQASLLTRALAYSRELRDRAGPSVVVGVVYRSGNVGSEAMSNDLYHGFQTLTSYAVRGLPFSTMRFPYESNAQLREIIRTEGIDALYVCTGLDTEVDGIAGVTRDMKIISMGGREEYVTRLLSIGVFVVDNKPAVLLNIKASEAEGAAFSSDLL